MTKITFLLLLILSISIPFQVKGSKYEDYQKGILESYTALEKAEKAGGDISINIIALNRVANLPANINEKELDDAIILAKDIKQSAIKTEQDNLLNNYFDYARAASVILVLGASAFYVLKYSSRIYYMIWIRYRGNWRIEKK